ncbi:hypothetical protein AB0H57_27450 [Micromonospora sp. NPDC050686]|uniref:hypothetical protein n=1 Tax=Micromonospora sp. NPDC050686 TaxID=3154631 RepID=UPI0033FC10E0
MQRGLRPGEAGLLPDDLGLGLDTDRRTPDSAPPSRGLILQGPAGVVGQPLLLAGRDLGQACLGSGHHPLRGIHLDPDLARRGQRTLEHLVPGDPGPCHAIAELRQPPQAATCGREPPTAPVGSRFVRALR